MRVPNAFTSGLLPRSEARVPNEISAIPPCAASMMNFFSASDSVLTPPPVAPVPVAVPGVPDAARLIAVSVAGLGVLDAGRGWVKAAGGWNVISLPGQYSLAARLQHERETTVVSDMSADPRFAAHPMVSGAPFLRFLAAEPLIDDEGFFLGALTILDRTARALTGEAGDILRNLAARVVAELRAR